MTNENRYCPVTRNRKARQMRNTDAIIGLISERGKKGLPLERVYKLLFNRNLYLAAYGKIYRNAGAMTHGVTDETPDGMSLRKIDAIIEALRYERYQWLPARRTYIPKKNGNRRPLGIPIRAVHYPSFQAMFGIPCVLLLVDRELRSTVITLLYHNFPNIASVSVLPLPFHGLAQSLDDLGRERNPAWPQRGGANALQEPRFAPV